MPRPVPNVCLRALKAMATIATRFLGAGRRIYRSSIHRQPASRIMLKSRDQRRFLTHPLVRPAEADPTPRPAWPGLNDAELRLVVLWSLRGTWLAALGNSRRPSV
ncbi:hypothetical protein HYQ46_000432 [Verticillium longisporum]|nr:hypothetical protein HYQ46_000432 [Verticillium longisporum]